MLELLKAKRQLKGKSSMCSGNKYQITITRKDNGESISFVYHDNYLNKSTLKDFMYAVLNDKYVADCFKDYKDFMKHYGYVAYNDNYKEAKRVFNGCVRAKTKIEALFTKEEINELWNEVYQ